MTMRQLTEPDYDCLLQVLHSEGLTDAFGIGYRIIMTAAQQRYELHIQPDSRRRVYLLYALRLEEGAGGAVARQVSARGLAAALLELLVEYAHLCGSSTKPTA